MSQEALAHGRLFDHGEVGNYVDLGGGTLTAIVERRSQDREFTVDIAIRHPASCAFLSVLVHLVGGEPVSLQLPEERSDALLNDQPPYLAGRLFNVTLEDIVQQFIDKNPVRNPA